MHQEDIDILRRIAERGLSRAQKRKDSEYVDIFQHMLDKISYINMLNELSWIVETEEKLSLYDR